MESNHLPPACKAGALPNELHSLRLFIKKFILITGSTLFLTEIKEKQKLCCKLAKVFLLFKTTTSNNIYFKKTKKKRIQYYLRLNQG
jgi:hypothetical protein